MPAGNSLQLPPAKIGGDLRRCIQVTVEYTFTREDNQHSGASLFNRRRQLEWLKGFLSGQITQFAVNDLLFLKEDLELNFPFYKQLVVAGEKNELYAQETVIAVDKYFDSLKYGDKDFNTVFSKIIREAQEKEFYDLINKNKKNI